MGLFLRRFFGQTQAELVRHDHPIVGGDQCRYHIAPKIASVGIAVEEDERIVLAFIYKVHAPTVYGRVAWAVRPCPAGLGWQGRDRLGRLHI